ncbi:MAG: transporter substrate-binding domain-containing protein, partial [Burkholderiales bacterium]|nr:transporter substrate-binding domain-containing protein [Burkholderiales bacterium]
MTKFVFFVLWILLQLGPLVPSVSAQEKLEITLTEQDYPPLILYGKPESGLLTDIVRESFRLAHVDVHFIEVPNNRAITGVMQGLYDGSYGWAHSAERDAKLLYSSKPVYSLRIVFFQRVGEHHPWTILSDIKNATIGITYGNHYSDEFSALVNTGVLQTDAAPSDVSNFKKLLKARIDLFPIDLDT